MHSLTGNIGIGHDLNALADTTYLRIATVIASGEVAQGQITSGFSPWD